MACKMKSPAQSSRVLRYTLGSLVFCWFSLWPVFPGSATELLSKRDPSLAASAGGNDNSGFSSLSADGRFVLFFSSANNLVAGDNSQFQVDVLLRDRASNTTALVSANCTGTGGGNDNSTPFQVSTNGRYVLFQSDASDLLPGDTNAVGDIFVRDVLNASNVLVSVAMGGGWANGASAEAVMTPDGRYVAFVSSATNLVAGDTNGIADVFLRDLVAQTTILVTTGAFGTGSYMAEPVINPDGRVIAFSSSAKGLAPGVPTASKGEIYAFKVPTGVMTWVSSNTLLTVSNILRLNNMPSYHPVLSDDGNIVAFKTGWTNGAVAPASPGVAQAILFRYDFSAGTNSVIATNAFPRWRFGDDVYGPSMSTDGRFIAYTATNRIPVSSTSIQLWDAQLATNVAVSVNQSGALPTNSYSDAAVLSADGRFVLFLSGTTNLTGNAISNGMHIYLRDLQAAVTKLVDVDSNGIGSVESDGSIPGLSADGRIVGFDAQLGDVSGSPGNVFIRDMANGTNELISAHLPGLVSQSGDNSSLVSQLSLSDDGSRVIFVSYADDLVPNDTNRAQDVFVHDFQSGINTLVSVGLNGAPAAGASFSPTITHNGRFVAFVSTATNLLAGPTNAFKNVFLRDLQTQTAVLASVSTNALNAGNGDASNPVVSEDGRYVVFLSSAKNLVPGITGSGPYTYLRDMNLGTTLALNGNAISSNPPAMNADGHYVAYFGAASQRWVWNTWLGARIYTNTAAITSAALSADGRRLLYTTATGLFAVDLIGGTNLFAIPAKVPIRNFSPWAADGRSFVFFTGTNAVATDTNGANDGYLCDLPAGTLTLVSSNAGSTGSAAGSSDSPVISGDGRFVVYRSYATNLIAGDTSPPPNIYRFDRLTGSNSLLSAAAPGGWTTWNSKPVINGDGRVVLFQSLNPSLVANDLNRVPDVFGAVLPPWGTADTDGDGIPDLWMTYFFGHATGLAGDWSRAQDDADGDGVSNLDEFLAGTDPLNPASVLSLQIQAQVLTSGSVQLFWPASPGKNYCVQFKNDLIDPAWSEMAGATVMGIQGSCPVTTEQASRYYRVVVE